MPVRWQTGVYRIRNLVNGKVYVGSASIGFSQRWRQHRNTLRSNRHGNRHLRAAWNLYGEQSFAFEILERCAPVKNVLLAAEQKWIDHYDAANPDNGYNLSPTAGNCSGVVMPEEGKRRIAEAAKRQWQNEEHRATVSAKVSATLKGRALPRKVLAKRTKKQRPGTVARNKSLENRAKVSASLMGHDTPKEVRDKIRATLRRRLESGEVVAVRGEDLPQTKMTEQDVKELRNTSYYRGLFAITARRLGVTESVVRDAFYGRSWRHLL